MDTIKVQGAREHNLKNISVAIPKNKLVVFTGLSGSGKSSLAFDTIYAEGQRRYVESLSSYARQFLGIMKKPNVDSIEGLSPAISIDQKGASHNPRSTVGTVTEIYDYLRLLFARVGHPHCPKCGREIAHMSKEQITDAILSLPVQKSAGKAGLRVFILAPIVKDRKGEYAELFLDLKKRGYRKIRLDGKIYSLDDHMVLLKNNKHTIEAVVDALVISKETDRLRVVNDVEQALKLGNSELLVSIITDKGFAIPDKPQFMEDELFSEKFACPVDSISLPEIEPRIFSFNTPHGACPSCNGLGVLLTVEPELVFNNNLSISEGGIMPFSATFIHDSWFARTLKTFCRKNGISLSVKIATLPKKQKELLLNGTGDTLYEVEGENRFGKPTRIIEPFIGIAQEIKRRHQQTESLFLRANLEKFMRYEKCPLCLGSRLKKEALLVSVMGKSIVDVADLAITDCFALISGLQNTLSHREKQIAQGIIKEISERLTFLLDVGLEYLTLSRAASSLSGGEAQRIRLASQIGSGLTGVLYVLDEPSIGLHPKDNGRLIKTLKKLRDLGNTVIVVEHDEETMRESDYLFDFGPQAGLGGGEIIAEGTPDEIKKNPDSLTGQYLSHKKRISVVRSQETTQRDILRFAQDDSIGAKLTVANASEHNLQNITVAFPLRQLVVITGASGSGKSTLMNDIVYRSLMQHENPFFREKPGKHDHIDGMEHIRHVFFIDQSPIGRTPRSNPATYTGAFNYIREIFATTKEARLRGYSQGRFSFNVKGGRCEACMGEGQIKIEMQFLPDVYVPCEVCNGKQYTREALEIFFNGKNIADVLQMSIKEAAEFFSFHPALSHKLQTLVAVGLSYVKLGQPAPTLSGGEAQRVKLATELSKKGKDALYLLDEPTTGLHFADLEKLLHVLRKLVDNGNSCFVIEHNLDVIKNADYIIDLGPEGGTKGGQVVATGTPYQIAHNPNSQTGYFLKSVLE